MEKVSLLLTVILAAITFSNGSVFAADTLTEIQKRGVLRIGLDPGYMPFELTSKKGRAKPQDLLE